MSSLFAAVLGVNPIERLLSDSHALSALSAAQRAVLTGREFFPSLISGPFHHGLAVVFVVAAVLSVLAGLASLLRGGHYVPPAGQPAGPSTDPSAGQPVPSNPNRERTTR